MAAALLEPSDGEVEIAGWPAGSQEARATTSFLPDEPVLYDDLSVREHGSYISRLHGGTGWDDYCDELAERLSLIDRVDDLPSRFSRGLRQKTSIILALIRPFSLMLVDEPFVGLDQGGKGALLELFDEVHGDGAALVVATHDPEFVERVDRCIALATARSSSTVRPRLPTSCGWCRPNQSSVRHGSDESASSGAGASGLRAPRLRLARRTRSRARCISWVNTNWTASTPISRNASEACASSAGVFEVAKPLPALSEKCSTISSASLDSRRRTMRSAPSAVGRSMPASPNRRLISSSAGAVTT